MIKAKRLRALAAGAPESAPLAKAREREASGLRPQLARAELLDKPARARFEAEIDDALKRRSTGEARLSGALRAVAPLSPALRASLGEATSVLVRRGSRQRELYGCGLRALAEAQDRQSAALLREALSGDEAGGAAALSAACFSKDPELSALLAKVAASRQSHLAFGAELARVARRESNGALLAQLAPMIKESHRISMCVELFLPLLRAAPVPAHVGPALAVLRGAERHLGRWLVLAEVAVRAGDLAPLHDATARAKDGAASSRPAWTLVAWALSEADAARRGAPPPPPPATRPTLELVARLSDRPSADRDTTFLFRMARAGAASARPMLEALAHAGVSTPLADETAVRAAVYLARDHDRPELREALAAAASGGREELRGLAVAGLWDASLAASGDDATAGRARVADLAGELLASRSIGNVAWGALIRAAFLTSSPRGPSPAATVSQRAGDLLSETLFRWIHWGWLE